MTWKSGRLTSAVLRSPAATKATVRFNQQSRTVILPADLPVKISN
jgi:hypothetical protein